MNLADTSHQISLEAAGIALRSLHLLSLVTGTADTQRSQPRFELSAPCWCHFSTYDLCTSIQSELACEKVETLMSNLADSGMYVGSGRAGEWMGGQLSLLLLFVLMLR